jgi:hypothetical protein
MRGAIHGGRLTRADGSLEVINPFDDQDGVFHVPANYELRYPQWLTIAASRRGGRLPQAA